MKTRQDNLTEEIVEIACRAWYDNGLYPGQYTWDRLVEEKDPRLIYWRADMRAALVELKEIEAEGHTTGPDTKSSNQL